MVFDGVHGIFNGDESLPYPDKVRLSQTYGCIDAKMIWNGLFRWIIGYGLKMVLVLSWFLCCRAMFQHNDHYSATKAEGEQLVIKSNGVNGLLTCCIRPSSIFGPGDMLLTPSLVDAARAGKSKVCVCVCVRVCVCVCVCREISNGPIPVVYFSPWTSILGNTLFKSAI